LAATLDTKLGSASFHTATSHTLTTTAAAAALSRVIVLISYFSSSPGTGITGVTIGGTAATRDGRHTNGGDLFEIWSRHVAGGLANTSAIVATGTAGGGCFMGAISFLGIQSTAGYVITTAQNPSTGASWSSGTATNTGQADAVFVGGAGYESATNPTNSTVTSGTEIYSLYDGTDQQGWSSGYKISTTVAASSITGTLSNSASTSNTGLLVIYSGLAVPADNTTKPARAGMFTPQLRQDGWF
jgi:hypothetical protein